MAEEKVLDGTNIAFDANLDCLSAVASNLGVAGVRYIAHKPVNQFSSESSVRFSNNNNGSSYLYLPHTSLEVKRRIVKGDRELIKEQDKNKTKSPTNSSASKLDTGTDVTDDGSKQTSDGLDGPVNGLFHALFDNVQLSLNSQVVSNISGYSFKAMANLLLETSDAVKKTLLKSVMFEWDTPGAMNDPNLTELVSNKGLKKR